MQSLTTMLITAAQVSGVIAVVVYGLYGSAITICFAVQGLPVTHAHPDGPVGCCSSSEWGLSPKVAESGVFDEFWDTIGFGITGMVFFFSGVSSVNFFVRSAQVGWLSLSLGVQQSITRTETFAFIC